MRMLYFIAEGVYPITPLLNVFIYIYNIEYCLNYAAHLNKCQSIELQLSRDPPAREQLARMYSLETKIATACAQLD